MESLSGSRGKASVPQHTSDGFLEERAYGDCEDAREREGEEEEREREEEEEREREKEMEEEEALLQAIAVARGQVCLRVLRVMYVPRPTPRKRIVARV